MQSVLAPKGIQAEQIAELVWLLFGFGALVLALVIAGLGRGGKEARAGKAGEAKPDAGIRGCPIVQVNALKNLRLANPFRRNFKLCHFQFKSGH